ncbi:MAG TPA: apolipoprotein N-acyltransferase [Caulobacteraceae bacterium]|nr:apolipoprotein N-acyltransferase [Caulobacteraceae bacterium]
MAAGAGAALAHPPFGILPGLLGYPLLMWLVDRAGAARPIRSSFLMGWLAGLAFFAISLWWVAEAFYVDAENQGWMAPFAVLFLATGLALFWGAAAALYRTFAATGARRVLLFAGLLAAFEWLRGHVLTGLPWDLPGETWRAGSAPSQAASLVGVYALSWITLAAVSVLAVAREGRAGLAAAVAGVAAIAGLYGFGAWRLAHAAPLAANASWIRIVQADVKQESKYDQRIFDNIFARYIALTRAPADRPADIVVWPEGAIPAALDEYLAPGAWTRDEIVSTLRPGQTLLVGGYRFAQRRGGEVAFNSLVAVRRTGAELVVTALYDKYRLVPFGEFLPLDGLLSPLGVKQMVHVGDGFAPGPRPRPIVSPGAPPVQPLICYESLFPGFTREGARASGIAPAWIVNVSNDAWFGATSGPWQHLNIASYRAIEEGVPMARATPTGVSAMIDAYGRVLPGKLLGHAKYGVIDAPLPPALAATPYRRWGDLPFLVMLLISLFGTSVPWRATLRRNG